jgi:hypothetical protein
MVAIEPDENPTRTFTWTSLVFLSHINRRTIDDRFSLPIMGDFFLLQRWWSNPGPVVVKLFNVCFQRFPVSHDLSSCVETVTEPVENP